MISVGGMSRVATILGAAQLIVGIAVSVFPNPEGWVGGVLYAAVHALPLFLIGLLLRSRQQAWRTVAGWLGLAFGVFYTMVVVGNWPGFTTQQAIIAVGITVPTVVADAAVFWAAVLHRPGRSAFFPPQAS